MSRAGFVDISRKKSFVPPAMTLTPLAVPPKKYRHRRLENNQRRLSLEMGKSS
jgi:hypothetical protein